ncbi:MAG: AIPR family protein [Muribaculaceae bacterium]|nr:AIPR family protein [Muribaculaceae bacterium]
MSDLIKEHIRFAQEEIKNITGNNISPELAFSHLLLKYRFDVNYSDQIGLVTDGSNDGGIDFLYYDEEDAKVVLCQSKYADELQLNDIIAELQKMHSTIRNFKKSNTGIYNENLRQSLQNAIDRLPDDNSYNFEYYLFTTAPINVIKASKKIENTCTFYESVSIVTSDQIEKLIEQSLESLSTVEYEKIRIDRPHNFLEYESDDSKGIMCNVLSKSLISLWNKYAGNGLFDLNIRRYIRNTLVDNGINRTLDNNRSNFWFLNNGVIIACENYEIDGDTIKLFNFSIVNGGQTTTLIGNYKGNNSQDFYIPCKIVATKDDAKSESFFTHIAEATNSQKPIYARDLKSNAPEMVRLHKWLKSHKIYLEIKRGYKPKFKPVVSIKNDELGQLILSFAFQRPGTSRSGKKVIFENQALYDQLYKVNYEKDEQKKSFLIDLIDLKSRYDEIEIKLKKSFLNSIELEVLKNGRQTIFALMGMCYRLINDDITEKDIQENPKSLESIPFIYGAILSHYQRDDINIRIEAVIKDILQLLAEAYEKAVRDGITTSVSNFMKTDQRYYNDIASSIIKNLRFSAGKDLIENSIIFKRELR